MHKTSIEWVKNPDGTRGFCSNPIKGICKVDCSYCYAKGYYKRFKLDPKVRFDYREVLRPFERKNPAGIFLCSTHELFGEWIPEQWKQTIFQYIIQSPQHRFYILTKRPGNIHMEEMPSNIWLGVTITGEESKEEQVNRLERLMDVKASIHFVSFEPLLGPIAQEVLEHIADGHLDWIIVGAQTQPRKMPLVDWVRDVVNAREPSAMETALFMKNNLSGLTENISLVQEFPK